MALTPLTKAEQLVRQRVLRDTRLRRALSREREGVEPIVNRFALLPPNARVNTQYRSALEGSRGMIAGGAVALGSVANDNRRAASNDNEGQRNNVKEKKIGVAQGMVMIVTAAFIDFVQFLLTLLIIGIIINPLISVIAFILFWSWFSLNGVKFFSGVKGIARFGIMSWTFLSELVPLLNAMPGWTVGVTMTYLSARRG